MSVVQISETSKLIKEKMDIELKEIIECFDFSAEFFITSQALRKLWGKSFQPNDYRVPLDLFIQAFDSSIGRDIVTSTEGPELN